MNRLLRLHRFSSLVARFEVELLERFSRGFGWLGKYLTIFKILFYAILFCHVIGCFWFLLSYMLTWQGYDNTWIWADGLINESMDKQYVRSFFFALVTCATIGYGGIVPRCNGEYIFVIILVLLGVTMYVTLLASLTVSAENRNASTHASEQFLQIMRQYFRTRNVDLKVRERCMQYYNAQGNALLKCRREDELINALPPLLKIELLAPLMAGAFIGLPLFSEFSDEFLDMLLSHLEARTYAPGDVISRIGERAQETFFIHRGSIDVRVRIAGQMRTIKALQAEESFGSECLLYDVPPERVSHIPHGSCTSRLLAFFCFLIVFYSCVCPVVLPPACFVRRSCDLQRVRPSSARLRRSVGPVSRRPRIDGVEARSYSIPLHGHRPLLAQPTRVQARQPRASVKRQPHGSRRVGRAPTRPE
jgi:CRP-like cAMP-binding protein